MNRIAQHIGYGFVTATLAVLSVGCSNDTTADSRDIHFLAEDANSSTRQIFDTQAASGARADAMLYGHHFDGDKLNSLGTNKLDLMLRDDDACSPMVVYLELPADDAHKTARHEAVTEYLKTKGLTDEQIALKDGPNPNSRSSSASALSNLGKTDSTSGGDAAASAAGGATMAK